MTLDVPAATETVVGAVEKATNAETIAGTADKYPDALEVKALIDTSIATSVSASTALGSLTSASGASVAFTGFSTGAKRVTINFSGVSTNGTDSFLVQLEDAGGVEASGYTSRAGSPISSASSTAGFLITPVNIAAQTYSGSVVISFIDSATNTFVSSGNLLHQTTSPFQLSSGTKSLSAELLGVLIKMTGSDTFDGGSFNVIVEY